MAASAITRLAHQAHQMPGFKPPVPGQRGTYLRSAETRTGLPYLERVPTFSGQQLSEAEKMGYIPATRGAPASFTQVEQSGKFAYLKRVAVPTIYVELHSRIPQILAELPARLNVPLEQVTHRIAVGAQVYLVQGGHVASNEPHLYETITNYPINEGESWGVGTDTYYAPFVEYGTVRSQAFPYLRPAAEDAAGELEPIFAEALVDL